MKRTSTDRLNPSQEQREKLALILTFVLLLITVALYALLFLRDDLPLIGLALLCLFWLLLLVSEAPFHPATPMDSLIIALLILLPINLTISPSPQLTLVKVYGLVLSFSLFFVIVRLVRFRKTIPLLILALMALAFGTALLGLIATDWSVRELGFISRVYQQLPQFAAGLTGIGINHNTMGGALTFFPALLFSLLWDQDSFNRLIHRFPKFKNFPIWVYKLLVFLIFGLVMSVLLLTQSRGAWVGVLLGLFIFLVWKDKRTLLIIPIGLASFFLIISNTKNGSILNFIHELDWGQGSTLSGRLQIWSNAVGVIKDFPITGIGLDAFSDVTPIYFRSYLQPNMSILFNHAHNNLLSAAVEMGIPALVLYVSFLTSFGSMARHAWQGARTINRVLIMGLVCGMISHQIFGIMDAFTLGKSLGFIMWVYFAVLAALFVHKPHMLHSRLKEPVQNINPPFKLQLPYLIKALVAWLLLSFIALTFCQINVYLSLLLAVLGGLLLGFFVSNNLPATNYLSSPVPVGGSGGQL